MNLAAIIAGLSTPSFEALLRDPPRSISKADIAAAKALRAGKRKHADDLLDPNFVAIRKAVDAAMAEQIGKLGNGPKLPAKSPHEMQTSLNTKETKMAGGKCPKCGHSTDDIGDFEKRAVDYVAVAKAALGEVEAEIAKLQKAHSLTREQAVSRLPVAMVNAAHLAERVAKFGPAYAF